MTSSTASCGGLASKASQALTPSGTARRHIPLGQLELDEVSDVCVIVCHEDTDGAGIRAAGRRRHGTPGDDRVGSPTLWTFPCNAD